MLWLRLGLGKSNNDKRNPTATAQNRKMNVTDERGKNEADQQSDQRGSGSELTQLLDSPSSSLHEINEKEKRNNDAFRSWVGNNNCFFNMPRSNQEDLALYVESLNREIADLEAVLARNEALMRHALINEAVTWQGDYSRPVHMALASAAKRAGVELSKESLREATELLKAI